MILVNYVIVMETSFQKRRNWEESKVSPSSTLEQLQTNYDMDLSAKTFSPSHHLSTSIRTKERNNGEKQLLAERKEVPVIRLQSSIHILGGLLYVFHIHQSSCADE